MPSFADPARPAGFAADARPVLFLSSNGIGLGHLSRQLAIGARLPPTLQPVFYSQSSGIRLARAAGFLTAHTQHHRYSGMPVEDWNKHLGRDLLTFAQHLDPAAIVVDCTVIFGGYMRLLESCAGRVPRVWIRRGFLAEEHARHLSAATSFDAVIEPGDLAADLDVGPSAGLRDQVIAVPPVLYVAPQERLTRQAALNRLGLTDDRPTVALLLGHTLGARTAAIRSTICAALAASGVRIVDVRSPLDAGADAIGPAPSPGLHRADHYPAFELSRAFDGMITLAGYNAFHEAMLGRIPTLFLVWPQPGMDRQDLRAEWATSRGLAISMAAEPLAGGDGSGVADAVAHLLSGAIDNAFDRSDVPIASDGANRTAALVASWAIST
jgi:hypothetical protein